MTRTFADGDTLYAADLNSIVAGQEPTPRDFGAKGDGAADDTGAWQAALATGRTVVDRTGGTYRITGTLSLAASGQRILGAGPGQTVFQPQGSLRLFSVTGFHRCGIEDVGVDGAAQTGGETLWVSAAHRTLFRGITTYNAHNWAHVERTNVCTFRDCWNQGNRGAYSYRWKGAADASNAVLTLDGCVFSGDPTHKPIGIDWDGNCHSLYLTNGGCLTGHGRSLWARDTANSGDVAKQPSLLELSGFAFEYCDHGPTFDVGTALEFVNLYSHGHALSSGLTFGAGVGAIQARVANAKLSGNARYGIETANRQHAANLFFSNNALGDVSGTVRASAPGFEADPLFYMQVQGGNPVLAWGTGATQTYNRTTARMAHAVAGAEVLGYGGARIDLGRPVRFPPYTVATLPAAAGDAAGATVRVTDRNHRLATSDGTNWRWAGDGAVVA